MVTARISSHALADEIRWLTGQIPQIRAISEGISSERPALADALEAAELGHVEVGVLHLAAFVQLDRDLGVPLDPGDRIDDNIQTWRVFLIRTRWTGRR